MMAGHSRSYPSGGEPIEAGRVLGERYRLERLLHVGQWTDVYAGVDLRLGRPVAVRVLSPARRSDSAARARFQQEAQLAAGISHPNVVAIYDWGRQEDVEFAVVEHLPGPSLLQQMERRRRFPESEALSLALGLVRALQALHRLGIVHGDLNPRTVLLDAAGRPKLIGFALARAAGELQSARSEESPDAAAYRAPEQRAGAPLDPRSDLYAVGAILFEMLTGEGLGSQLAERLDCSSETRSLSRRLADRSPTVSPAQGPLLTRLLSESPEGRFQTAEELLAALERTRALLPTPAGPRLAQGGPGAASPLPPVSGRGPREPPRTAGPSRPAAPRRSGDEAAGTRALVAAIALFGLLALLAVLARAGGLEATAAALVQRRERQAPQPPAGTSPSEQRALERGSGGAPPSSGSPIGEAARPGAAPPASALAPVAAAEAPLATSEPSAAASARAAAISGLPTTRPAPAAPPLAATPAGPAATSPPPGAAIDAGTPVGAVLSFYAAVSSRDFDRAALLWSPRMRQQYPPPIYINERFSRPAALPW